MATNRLTFLYPHLCRTGRWSEPAAAQAVAARKSRQRRRQVEATPAATSFSTSAHLPTTPISRCQHAAPFTTHAIARQAAFPKRHGKAVEPLPLPALESTQQASSSEQNKIGEQAAAAGSPPAPPPQQLQQPPPTPDVSASDSAAAATTAEPDPRPSPPPRPPPKAAEDQNEDLGKKAKGTSGPMDTILHMEPPPSPVSPVSYASDSTKDPPNHMVDTHMLGPHLHHLHPPPYVHHFDSYSLVKQLSAGGYTLNQSITAMKAVRGLLASNLDVAQSQLVSKSDVENETYLFRAACSELSAEVHNNRRVADEALRQQRTHLQHEVDILTQHLNQELLTLTDSVRGMFNDRRMAVREEQKTVESRVISPRPTIKA